MSETLVLAPEALSDALFKCAYGWLKGHPCGSAELKAATRHHPDSASPCGALAATLAEIHALSYEEICGRGWLLSDTQKQHENRRALVAGIIGEAQVKALLCDTGRLNRLFPATGQPVASLVAQEPPETHQPHVALREGALYWTEPKTDPHTGKHTVRESWLCDALAVVGIGQDEAERYLILQWTPAGSHQPHTEALPMRVVGEREGWATLRAGGLAVTTKSHLRAILADYLQLQKFTALWTITHATGWQNGAYLMPDGTVIGEPLTPVLFRGKSGTAAGYTVSGTVESWRQAVAALAAGNPSMMLGIACALAAPLIGLVGADGFGVHLFGGSSSGKTTICHAATSVYGEPERLKLTWYSTALGLVNEAAAHNDGFMPLDEIGQNSNRRAVADAAYALFNGVGKIQGAREGGNRELNRWRAMVFSTGETDLESYLRAEGGRVNAGQLVRLLNIPISKAEVFHGLPDGKAHADALRDAAAAHHGAVGRAWIAHLAGQQTQARAVCRQAGGDWLARLPEDAGEQVRRVASRFAVLETALTLSAFLTGWTVEESRAALVACFTAWVQEFGSGNREQSQAIAQASGFLNAYGMSRYAPLPYDPRDLPIPNLAGYRETDPNTSEVTFFTFATAFENEIAQGYNPRTFAQALAAGGMLVMPTSGRGFQRKMPRVNGRQQRGYHLRQPPDSDAPD